MARRMLIDATHPEETRVVVLNGSRLEEFDFETSTKRQIKGNIYLAKITRVEPSLQAAFVEYGGNRHGFLAFSEIHPDYYRIPVSDRDALVAAQHEEDEEGPGDWGPAIEQPDADDHQTSDDGSDHDDDEPAANGHDRTAAQVTEGTEGATSYDSAPAEGGEHHEAVETDEPAVPLETVGGDEFEEEQSRPRVRHYRNYKIQEVIKRRQIILIQVTKEERGNKGAALTTYLSLAGRYCVLMPNAGRGGGVSRKITSAADRRRLKELMEELAVPEGMGVIVRTAGSERSKTEIKRDYEYLLRLWDEIRELTLRSSAPALIYEEGSLIKRAIRDLYARDIEDVLVEGEEGYRTAKGFMRMLTPSHASRVKLYRDPVIPLFHRFQIDAQIDQIHSPVAQLRSGGYIVINPTEALVSIDVNSGRATKERNIEETATKTNLEAADEIGRQLRLRDLAGLVVIDFIDMEENRNQKSVEARLKDAMKVDRARIQLGRISPFGLLELSRQRLRSSLIEASTLICPHCNGTGTIRSTELTTLVVMRALEEEGIRRRTAEVTIYVPTQIALYLLNQKREALIGIEQRYGFRVTVAQDDSLIPPAYRLERMRALSPEELAALPAITLPPIAEEEEEEFIEEDEPVTTGRAASGGDADETEDGPAAAGDENRPHRKRRRRKRRHPGDAHEGAPLAEGSAPNEGGAEGEFAEGDEEAEDGEEPVTEAAATAEGQDEHKRRRRGRRGGRRRRRDDDLPEGTAQAGEPVAAEADGVPSPFDYANDGRPVAERIEATPVPPLDSREVVATAIEAAFDATPAIPEAVAEDPAVTTVVEPVAKPKRAPRRKAAAAPAEAAPVEAVAVEAEPEPKPAAKPRRTRKPAAEKVEPIAVEEMPVTESDALVAAALAIAAENPSVPAPESEPANVEDDNRPRKGGWWQKLIS